MQRTAALVLLLFSANALAADQPDLTGVWIAVKPAKMLSDVAGNLPPLLPDSKAAYEKHQSQLAQGDTSYDPASQCISPSVPWLLAGSMPVEIVQRPGGVYMLFQWNRLFRVIDLNAEHSEPPGNTYFGQAVGQWQDDVLVVDTNAIEANSMLDAAGLPHSDQLHTVERYRLARGGKRLVIDLQIEDPATFSSSWSTRLELKRLKSARISEDVCVERLGLAKYR